VGLVGRADECRQVERLLDDVKAGHARALVIRGEAGIGKTALLDHAIASARGFQVVRATGIESEIELVFAGLHQLCAPLLGGLPSLPEPQRDAMRVAFGLDRGSAPDRFLIGLALLSLASEAAEQEPLLCVVDDTQWLDRASIHALSFVARRLLADRVGLLLGTREPMGDLRGLPELVVNGLSDGDAHALLATVVRGPLDARVRERIIAETHGNPLALVEWPRGLSAAELASGFALPALPMAGQIEESFRRRLEEVPAATQRFLTVAAAEPTGDPVLLWRATSSIGVSTQDASPAIDAGLIEVGARVSFRHPLVRSAAYAAASRDDRRLAHRALADVTDATADPDLRAWHLALATAGPDAEVAAELERAAGRSQARGAMAAAAALLERSAALTVDPAVHAQRTIAAASAYLEAGAPDAVAALLSAVEAAPLDDLSRARIDSLRGYAASAWGEMGQAADLLLSAARRLERVDVHLARDAYLNALIAASEADTPEREARLVETATAARAAPAPHPERPHDLLLDGRAIAMTDGPAAAAAMCRQALEAFRRTELSGQEAWWFGYQCGAATLVWDHASYHALATRWVQAARDLGALRMLPIALTTLAAATIYGGDLSTASSLLGEAQSVIEATASSVCVYPAAQLAGVRGRESEALDVIGATIDFALAHRQSMPLTVAKSATATLYNGLGRYDQALVAAQEADSRPLHASSHLTLHELVEAAVRSAQPALTAGAFERLSESAQASGTDWGLGILARCQAMLATGDAAERLYLEAIERLDGSPVRPEAARAHLLYGEWLRREDRRLDARAQLRPALEMFDAIGMEAFADRARRELRATGETARRRSVDTYAQLTAQEAQVAMLARDGLSNPEIGTRLFISTRTVQYHLGKVFTKLGVTSRGQLHRALR
jgi:DNA-binding CsgD family transcriptional regulator